jgi:hypothetical protein
MIIMGQDVKTAGLYVVPYFRINMRYRDNDLKGPSETGDGKLVMNHVD